TEDERWNVIRYVQQIFAQPVMHDPDEGDPPQEYAGLTNPIDNSVQLLEEAKAIYTRECFVCHGDAGRGQGPYGDGLQPGPPDFGDGSYGDFTDADYFWRISEGVPWTAMPTWKIEYGEEDRWKLVHYIRTIFIQNEERPPEPAQGSNFNYPDFYKEEMRFPDDVSFERGKAAFYFYCAHCHGLAGDGQGWDGQYLNPQPADFRGMRTKEMKPEAQGEHLAKITFGIKDTAMPAWGEILPLDVRWDAAQFIMGTFMAGKGESKSYFDATQLPANYILLSSDLYKQEGHTISKSNGEDLYALYCATCHGENGQGDGPGMQNSASAKPVAFPSDLTENYLYWRTDLGIESTNMGSFKDILSTGQIWDIVTATMDMIGSGGEGGSQ
ncbi:MAG: c-type cytochrome, partial [Anaerolineales bacterium]